MRINPHNAVGTALRTASFLFLLLPALFQAGPAGYLPGAAFLFLLLLCRLFLRENRRNITLQDDLRAVELRRGENALTGVHLKNAGPLPCVLAEAELTLADSNGIPLRSSRTSLALDANSESPLSFAIPAKHVGLYRLSVRQLRLYSPFGFFSAELPGTSSCPAAVLPRRWEFPDLLPEIAAGEDPAARLPTAPDGTDYSGVREYRPGDPMQRIHWKLSAHSGVLLTRLLEVYGSPGATVIADFDTSSFPPEQAADVRDALFEASSAVCRHALSAGLETELCLADRNGLPVIFPICAEEDAERPVREPELCSPPRSCAGLLMSRSLADGKGTIILIAGYFSEDTFQLAERLRGSGRGVVLLCTLPAGLSADEYNKQCLTLRHAAGAETQLLFWLDPLLPGGGVFEC